MKVNIPREVSDPYYRHKMPVLKVISEDDDMKTRLPNIVDISKALERNPNHIAKFLSIELGTDLITKSGFVLDGRYEAEDLATILDKFIDKYVVCEWCQNPKTDFFLKKDSLRLKCRSCGQRNECDRSHKITGDIIKSLE